MVAKRHITELDIAILRELQTGKILQASISDLKVAEMKAKGLGTAPSAQVRKLEDMGIIIGYVPVVSEEGHKAIAAMEAVFALNSKKEPQAPQEAPP
jgi:DNA-binding Lrp family transcriptional regulator